MASATPKPSATMSAAFKSLLSTARHTLTGTTITAHAAPIESLFPKVDPAIDGADCDHDCESCAVSYPKWFKTDEDDKLYGHVKGWSQHVLVATGKTDWVRDVTDEKGSVMEAIEKATVKPSQGVSNQAETSAKTRQTQNRTHSKLTYLLEAHAIRLEYPYTIPLRQLLGANNGPPPPRLYPRRECYPQVRQRPHHGFR